MSSFRMIFGKAGTRYEIDGRPVSRRAFERRAPRPEPGIPNTQPSSVWPKESTSCGCTPKTAPAVRRRIADAEIRGAKVLPNGNLEFGSRRVMEKVHRLFGLVEANPERGPSRV